MQYSQNDSVLLNCCPNAFNLEHCLVKTKVRTDNWSKAAIEKKIILCASLQNVWHFLSCQGFT